MSNDLFFVSIPKKRLLQTHYFADRTTQGEDALEVNDQAGARH
jgi:hypothetical protein